MITIKIPSYLTPSILKRMEAIKTSGEVFIIGGYARYYASLLLGGCCHLEGESPDDVDFTVIGDVDDIVKVGSNVDVEYDAPHLSMDRYMETRDFTVNQVAMNSETIFLTRKAVADIMAGVLKPLSRECDWDGYGAVSSRLYCRSVRFALKYDLKNKVKEPDELYDFDIVLQGYKVLKNDRLFEAYCKAMKTNRKRLAELALSVGLKEAKKFNDNDEYLESYAS